jgi:membrane protein implicated in regulation of membrane protease activity
MGDYMVYTWLGLMVVLIAIEAATVSLTTIWFAAGSLLAFFMALFGLQLWVQIVVFLVASTALLIFTRPIAVKYLKVGTTRTNVDSLIGQKGIVIMDILEHSTGQVKVKGQIWTAASETGDSIAKDTEIYVHAVEGVKLIVSTVAD